MARADKALMQRRIDDVLRVRLDGAEWWDLREYVIERGNDADSPWFVADGESPLSDAQLRRYQAKADDLIQHAHERSRRKLYRTRLARRRNIYARAITTGDLRTALAAARDEAELLGLYPERKISVRGKGKDGAIVLQIVEEIVDPKTAALDHVEEEVVGR